MDVTPIKFKFKYNTIYLTLITIALTGLIVCELLILWSLVNGFTWHKAISAFIFALLLSCMFNDLPRYLIANHDGISIKKFIGCAHFPISDIIDIREPEQKSFKVKFFGAGYASSENKLHLLSTYLTQKKHILILVSKFGQSKLCFAISCPNKQAKVQLLNYMGQIRQTTEDKVV